jgi:hypothetical protein
MHHEWVKQHLELADRHVSEGIRHAMRQRALVERLERGGHDIREANSLLRRFEDTLELHVRDRDRLRNELD